MSDRDDALLAALGDLAREQEDGVPSLAELEALTRGERQTDDAAFAGLADDDGTAALLAALAAPVDDAAHDRFADAALAAFDAPVPDADPGAPVMSVDGMLSGDGVLVSENTPVADAGTAPGQPSPDQPARDDAVPDNVVQFRPRRRVVPMVVVGFAAAAAVTFFALRPSAPPLPGYTATVKGGQQIVRGEDAPTVPLLGPGDRLSVVLTPATASGEVAVVGFVVPESGPARAWSPKAEISADGAVRIVGTGSALGLAPSGEAVEPVTLRVAVGRPGSLPKSADAEPDAAWRWFDVAVRLSP